MPEPRCIRCSQGIPLDTDTYLNFNGPVRCPHCGFQNHMAFKTGTLLTTTAVLEEKYMIRESHTIPSQPLGDYEEAALCLTVGAWKACAVMARRAIQGALLVKGTPEGPPMKMINKAHQDGYLDTKQRKLADTVTFFGGKGAHPEDSGVNLVGEIEASNGLWVTKTLLLALFPPEGIKPL